jgi:hypothetical protein
MGAIKTYTSVLHASCQYCRSVPVLENAVYEAIANMLCHRFSSLRDSVFNATFSNKGYLQISVSLVQLSAICCTLSYEYNITSWGNSEMPMESAYTRYSTWNLILVAYTTFFK